MTSIDELFKQAGLPSKRKLDPIRDPNEIYKSAKLSSTNPARHAHVDDEAPSPEAGPSAPPDDDGEADYGPSAPPPDASPEPDDDDPEGGRFFGGGITATEAEVLSYVNGTDAAAPAKPDAAWVRRTALAFERAINRNAELRARFAGSPERFVESEADLDAAVRGWAVLAEHPALWAEFVRVGSAASLVGLLAHENADVAVSVVEVVGELTGEDVEASGEEWDGLVDGLLEADLLGLLVGTFRRLDEQDEADRAGVYHALEVVENLCSRAETADAVGRNEALLRWLLARVQRAETPVTQNKQYAAEILAILVQASAANRRRLAELDAADVMLQLVAPYRRRDPMKGEEEEEFMQNLFEALTCLVDEPEGKAKFVEAEGVELCLIMLKEGKMSKRPALRLLDHAVGGAGGAQVCQKVVEEGGLKATFTLFMKTHDHNMTEQLLGIFAWMLQLLPANSAERIRTLAKFVEKDYEKTAKLAKLRREYLAKVEAVEQQMRENFGGRGPEGEEEDQEWITRRFDAGLFCLQTVNLILAWLIAEDDGARKKIQALLADHDETFRDLKVGLEEQLKETDTETADGQEKRDILTTLMDFLQ